MTSTNNTLLAQPSIDDVERAVALATRAPSIHNTQPWRFVLTADALELWADRRRQLATADLDGRALLVSCGGALHLAGLGLAAQGWRTVTAACSRCGSATRCSSRWRARTTRSW